MSPYYIILYMDQDIFVLCIFCNDSRKVHSIFSNVPFFYHFKVSESEMNVR